MDSDSSDLSDEGLDLSDVFKGHNVKPYDIPSEKKMWEYVYNCAKSVYDGYKTTKQEDEAILA